MPRPFGSEHRQISVAFPIGYHSGSCGYCKDENSSASYYCHMLSLSVEHYQELVDRGWRRSGLLLYRPDASRACCPHWTIRLKASDYKTTRDQRHTLNKWNRFVLGDDWDSKITATQPAKSKAEKKRARNEFDFLPTVHASEASFIPDADPPLTPAHQFTVTIEPDTCTDEKYALFEHYQREIHHETPPETSKSGFKRFLCSSPLQRTTDPSTGRKYGSYHACYRLDGRLIAMSVLDLLTHAVSGVYFIYHTDFAAYSLGKISAMREVALAIDEGYDYYYMGYYIDACAKMRYKADYAPQQVLDLNTTEWIPLSDGLAHFRTRGWLPGRAWERSTATDASKQKDARDDQEMTEATTPPIPSHPNPSDATSSGTSIFELGMPGLVPLAEIEEYIKENDYRPLLLHGSKIHVPTEAAWEEADVNDTDSLRYTIAEMMGNMGLKVGGEVVVALQR